MANPRGEAQRAVRGHTGRHARSSIRTAPATLSESPGIVRIQTSYPGNLFARIWKILWNGRDDGLDARRIQAPGTGFRGDSPRRRRRTSSAVLVRSST